MRFKRRNVIGSLFEKAVLTSDPENVAVGPRNQDVSCI
jgi:hypothetical protein